MKHLKTYCNESILHNNSVSSSLHLFVFSSLVFEDARTPCSRRFEFCNCSWDPELRLGSQITGHRSHRSHRSHNLLINLLTLWSLTSMHVWRLICNPWPIRLNDWMTVTMCQDVSGGCLCFLLTKLLYLQRSKWMFRRDLIQTHESWRFAEFAKLFLKQSQTSTKSIDSQNIYTYHHVPRCFHPENL